MTFQTIVSIIQSTKEYQGWGYGEWGFNLFTYIFLGIIVELGWLLWGLWHQNRTLWEPGRKSAEGMAILPRFLCVTFYAVGFLYALQIRSIGLATALPLGLMHLGILLALWKINNKRLMQLERWVALGSILTVVLALYPPWTWYLYAAVAWVLVATCLAQPRKMWRNKSAEGMNWREPAASVFTTGMWVVFGSLIGSWLIASFSLVLMVIFTINLLLYCKYHKPKNSLVTSP